MADSKFEFITPDSAVTITASECVENHTGMEKIGEKAEKGFSAEDLARFKAEFEALGGVCEIVELKHSLPEEMWEEAGAEEAQVLIIRQGVNLFSGGEFTSRRTIRDGFEEDERLSDDVMEEMKGFEWDRKVFMRGAVKNKHARWNVCFAPEAQEPDYEAKKGRVVPFAQVPLLTSVLDGVGEIVGMSLLAEGNLYYDAKKTGIGYHGDTERRIVIGMRFGVKIPLVFRWFKRCKMIDSSLCSEVELEHGDMYIMSEKATGFDWKKRSQITLRHAAGCAKYTKPQKKHFPVKIEE